MTVIILSSQNLREEISVRGGIQHPLWNRSNCRISFRLRWLLLRTEALHIHYRRRQKFPLGSTFRQKYLTPVGGRLFNRGNATRPECDGIDCAVCHCGLVGMAGQDWVSIGILTDGGSCGSPRFCFSVVFLASTANPPYISEPQINANVKIFFIYRIIEAKVMKKFIISNQRPSLHSEAPPHPFVGEARSRLAHYHATGERQHATHYIIRQ